MRYLVLVVSLWCCHVEGQLSRRYQPEWKDLDSRPLPRWYDDAKVGIFLHWGVYSVPSYNSEWFWKFWILGLHDVQNYVQSNYPPKFTYQDFAPQFRAEFFDPLQINDRWGEGIPCHHGDFYNCKDRYNPGNVLINVGPTKEGTIAPIFQERLMTLGFWLRVNGEAIYGSSPWLHQKDTLNNKVWYTCKKIMYNTTYPISPPQSGDRVTAVYAMILKWPSGNVLKVLDVAKMLHGGVYTVTLLGNKGKLNWKIKNGEVHIALPSQSETHSKFAWTLKFSRDIVPTGTDVPLSP